MSWMNWLSAYFCTLMFEFAILKGALQIFTSHQTRPAHTTYAEMYLYETTLPTTPEDMKRDPCSKRSCVTSLEIQSLAMRDAASFSASLSPGPLLIVARFKRGSPVVQKAVELNFATIWPSLRTCLGKRLAKLKPSLIHAHMTLGAYTHSMHVMGKRGGVFE